MDHCVVQPVPSSRLDTSRLVAGLSDGAFSPSDLYFRHDISTVYPLRESGLYAPSRVSPGL